MQIENVVSLVAAVVSTGSAAYVLWEKWFNTPTAYFQANGLVFSDHNRIMIMSTVVREQPPDLYVHIQNLGDGAAYLVDISVQDAEVSIFRQVEGIRGEVQPFSREAIMPMASVGVAVWRNDQSSGGPLLIKIRWIHPPVRWSRSRIQVLMLASDVGSKSTKVAPPRRFHHRKRGEYAVVRPRPWCILERIMWYCNPDLYAHTYWGNPDPNLPLPGGLEVDSK